jgi:hypothetical protein
MLCVIFGQTNRQFSLWRAGLWRQAICLLIAVSAVAACDKQSAAEDAPEPVSLDAPSDVVAAAFQNAEGELEIGAESLLPLDPPLGESPVPSVLRGEGEDQLVPPVDVPSVVNPLTDEELFQQRVDAAVERAVAARLAGIPRPMYIPATDFEPPKGLVLYRTTHKNSPFPYAFAFEGYLQARWLELARGVTSWTDSAGRTFPITNTNVFNLNRVYLQSQGHVGSERVFWNISMFGSTDAGLIVNFVPLGFVGFALTEEIKLLGGVAQVPGTREWLMSSRWPMGVDRSMANTFFRPSYSPGFVVAGSLLENSLNFQAGVYNGIDGGFAGVFRESTSMAWAGNVWWEPIGPFGLGYSDMEHHKDHALRLGMSGTYARTPTTLFPLLPELSELATFANPENTVVRLSDGTAIAEKGALGPGTELEQFRYNLATIDAAWKYRGWSAFGEYYWRLLNGFVGKGDFDRSSLFDQGGNLFLGYCMVPRTYELYARSSVVTGPYGSGAEYGGGFNWYLNKTRQSRFTFETLYIDGSPAQNFLYPYRAGFTGTAFQTQYMAIF